MYTTSLVSHDPSWRPCFVLTWKRHSYLHKAVKELNLGLARTNPNSGRMKGLNQGPPDFKSSTLNHSATPLLLSQASSMQNSTLCRSLPNSLKLTKRKHCIYRRENYYYTEQTFFLGAAWTGSFAAGFPLNKSPSSSSSLSPPNRSTLLANDFVFVVSV